MEFRRVLFRSRGPRHLSGKHGVLAAARRAIICKERKMTGPTIAGVNRRIAAIRRTSTMRSSRPGHSGAGDKIRPAERRTARARGRARPSAAGAAKLQEKEMRKAAALITDH